MSALFGEDVKPAWLTGMTPRLEFLMQVRLKLPRFLQSLGNLGGMGERKMLPILGGDFEGPRLRGIVQPGGGEWPLIRPDGVGCVDARYTLATDDGTLINIKNTGYRHGPAEVMKRLDAKQELVDPAAYYMRTYTVLEAPVGKYDWLSRHVFVGFGERHPEANFFHYYQVL